MTAVKVILVMVIILQEETLNSGECFMKMQHLSSFISATDLFFGPQEKSWKLRCYTIGVVFRLCV